MFFQQYAKYSELKSKQGSVCNKAKSQILSVSQKTVLKIFNAQIAPILLYGAEVWGPFSNLDFESWDICNIEKVHTKFLKHLLGCNTKTCNNMIRAETGCQPLVVNLLQRYITYVKNLETRTYALCYDAITYESRNSVAPNFLKFAENFHFKLEEIYPKPLHKVKKNLNDLYNRYWEDKIIQISKALSFRSYKNQFFFRTIYSNEF